MRRVLVTALMLGVSVTACGSGQDVASEQALHRKLDINAIEQIEVKWHKASSTKDVDLMMSLWADNATFTFGDTILTGRDQIRDFFVHDAAPFQLGNHWISDTPAYKIRATVDGNRGTLYFECHYVDVDTGKVVAYVAADQQVARVNGRWVITRLVAATPTLSV
jgi:SnoaL-like protein